MKMCKITYEFQDGSSGEAIIDPNYFPMIMDLIHRVIHIQEYKTGVYETEKHIYTDIKTDYAHAMEFRKNYATNN